MINYEDLFNEAKEANADPRYFGLGFIQITVPSGRYHFYCKDLNPSLDDEEVHNHRYWFRSEVLKGVLWNGIYSVIEDEEQGQYEVADVTCKPGQTGEPEILMKSVSLVSLVNFLTSAGSSYLIKRAAYHMVQPRSDFVITRLDRGTYESPTAQVVRKKNSPFVCPYETPLTVDDCWVWIRKAIES